jgi:hypothetical protein
MIYNIIFLLLIMKHDKTLKLDYSTRLKINMIKHDNSIKNCISSRILVHSGLTLGIKHSKCKQ